MSTILQIQPAIFCENCKDCGARPVIKQFKGKYIIMCPNSNDHYSTKPGMVNANIAEWNQKNRKQKPLVITPMTSQKAS